MGGDGSPISNMGSSALGSKNQDWEEKAESSALKWGESCVEEEGGLEGGGPPNPGMDSNTPSSGGIGGGDLQGAVSEPAVQSATASEGEDLPAVVRKATTHAAVVWETMDL